MLLVKAKAGPSSIAGTGLFAAEFIPKGTNIWRFVPGEDEAYTKTEAEALPEPKRSEILSVYHSYVSRRTGRYIMCGDDAKYMNHSLQANVGTIYEPDSEEDTNPTLRDVYPGEELTIDYDSFAEEGTNF